MTIDIDTTEPLSVRPSKRRIAGQGAMLFSGFGAAQMLSFVRNALIGHALAKGDFGIAAAITLVLQMIETLTDLGADRLIMQAPDGDQPRFLGAAHTLLAARGVVLSAILFATGPWLAQAFGAAHAATAFQMAALVPLIKGFMHLDYRVAQRRFDNRPQLLIEVVPQAIALLLTWPLLSITRDYSAVIILAVAQATTSVLISHALSHRSYRFAADAALLKRQLSFGWPILASALPLVAVYQGDRLIVAQLAGMEQLANYTAAFMITMVPGLIAAKVGHALMLPLFSDTLRRGLPLQPKFKIATEATVVFAALYLAAFIVCGDAVLPIVFGANYQHLGAVTVWLAAMWALRMIQAVPGMALMAHGATKPFVVAGALRALALPVVWYAALHGTSIAAIAAIGCAFEAVSLVYIALRLEKLEGGLGLTLLSRSAYVLPSALVACLAVAVTPGAAIPVFAAAVAVMIAVAACGIALMPSLNALARRVLQHKIKLYPA